MHPLERALSSSGLTQHAFAEAIGKKQSYVSMLLHRVLKKNRPVPSDICPAIEKATGGAVTRFELRPDVFGEPPAKPAKRSGKSSLSAAA